MRTFIRVTEIWIPGPDRQELVFGGGLYGPLAEFGALSREARFRKGEGLPGRAWAERHPVVLTSFEGSYFRRQDAAAAAGLTCGIAMPVFERDELKAVAVFLCGDDADHVGAIEVWRNDPELEAEIGLADGYYGSAELFEMTSRAVKFGRGFGLPGLVWQTGKPTVIRDIYNSHRFLRREEALRVGLNVGLGLPFDYDPGRTWVMVFLSALGTPIARRFEIWTPDSEGKRLNFDSGLSDGAFPEGSDPPASAPQDGILGRASASRVPQIAESARAEAPWLLGAGEDGPAVALPVLGPTGRLKAVTLWLL